MRRSRGINFVIAVWVVLLASGSLRLQASPQNPMSEKLQAGGLIPRVYIVSAGSPDAKLEHRVDPDYPRAAKMTGVQGDVELRVTADANGNVSDIEVDSGNAPFVKAVTDAVRQWKYSPNPGAPTTKTMLFEFRLTRDHPRGSGSDRRYFPDLVVGVGERSGCYPEQAKEKNLQGPVLLEATLGNDGQVSNTRVLKSDGLLFAHAAAECIRGQVFLRNFAVETWRSRPEVRSMLVDFTLNRKMLSAGGPLPAAADITEGPDGLLAMRWPLAFYPAQAERDGIEGTVEVELTVDKDGKVIAEHILGGPQPLFEATLEASRQWRFAPLATAPAEVTLNYDFWIPK